MYIVEPILNRFYRKRMRAAIEFDQTGLFDVPVRAEDDLDDYLLYMHIPFCETLCPYCSFHRYEYSKNKTNETTRNNICFFLWKAQLLSYNDKKG